VHNCNWHANESDNEGLKTMKNSIAIGAMICKTINEAYESYQLSYNYS